MHVNWVRKEYETRGQKTLDFFVGIGVWLLINALFAGGFFLCANLATSTNQVDNPALYTLGSIGVVLCSVGPFIANIGGIIVLAIYRRWVAFGMLATLGALLVIAMCFGVVLIGMCGAGLQNL